VNNDNLTIIAAILTVFWAFPFLRMLSIWLEDRTLDGRLAFLGLAAHVIVLCTLWKYGSSLLLVIYLSLTVLAWLLQPLITLISDQVSMRKMHEEDMARYQRLLAVNPRNAAALSAIADIHLRYARIADAIAYYERAIEVDPDHSRRERSMLTSAREMLAKQPRLGRIRPSAPPPPLPETTSSPASPPEQQFIPEEAPSTSDYWTRRAAETTPAAEPEKPAPPAPKEPTGLDRWRSENR